MSRETETPVASGPASKPDSGHSAIGQLPAVYVQLAPELTAARAWREPRADCSNCVMLPEQLGAAAHPWAFVADARCCTYHPDLPNFLVGRALDRGGPGRELVRARLRDLSGVSPWGIRPSVSYRERREKSGERFGRDASWRCPFWAGGELACGVWHDRNAVCRTWFCQHGSGLFGVVRWTAARKLLRHIEQRVAEFLAGAGQAPEDGADSAAWERFFRECSARMDGLTDVDLRAIGDDELVVQRERFASALQVRDSGLPAVVVPVIRDFEVVDQRLWVHGYSRYDVISLPMSCIHFFAELDGRRDWRGALERARAKLTANGSLATPMTEALVRELYRVDVLQPPGRVLDDAVDKGMDLPPHDSAAAVPDVLSPALGRPIKAGSLVWIQGSVPLGSVIAPTSIFWFLARLDGLARWRDVLAAMRASDQQPIDESMVESLFRIGALQPPRSPGR